MYTDEDYEDKTDAERQRTRDELERTLPEMRGLPTFGQIVYGRMWPILNRVIAERANEVEASPPQPRKAPTPKAQVSPCQVGMEKPKVEEVQAPPLPPPVTPDEDLVELYNLLS